HEDHMMLYEDLENSMNRDHTDELLKDLAEARKKKKKRCPSRTSRSPGAFGSSQVPPPPPPPLSTNQEGQLHGSTSLSSSKIAASVEYKAWTMTDTRLRPSVSSIPEDLHMDDDMAPDAQVHSSNDEDIGNAHIPKVNLRQDWWKPLEEDRPATPEPAWFIPSSDMPVPKNNWVSALASTYSPPPEDSLLAKPLPRAGPPGQVTIQSDFFFNKDLEYLRYGSKGSRHALSISKMKEAYYLDVGLEQMVPDQIHTSEGDHRAVRTHMRILSVVRIEVFSMCGYDYMKKIVLRRADLNEHIITERDFKYLYPSDFEDLYLLNLQGHLNHLPPKDKKTLTTAVNLWTRHLMIMWFNEIHKFSDGTLHQIDEVLDYRVKEFKVGVLGIEGRKVWKNGRDELVYEDVKNMDMFYPDVKEDVSPRAMRNNKNEDVKEDVSPRVMRNNKNEGDISMVFWFKSNDNDDGFHSLLDGSAVGFAATSTTSVVLSFCSGADKFNGSLLGSFCRIARGGIEEYQLSQLRLLLKPVILSHSEDRWVWILSNDGGFRVKDVRRLLDDFFLPKSEVATRWVKCVPIKINVFAWRVSLDRLPTRLNLIRRNISVSSPLCPVCSNAQEDVSHLLYNCDLPQASLVLFAVGGI
nr:RNA-directed DNA polymerase, eukaryota [Tanacetum cinerariifolium]